MEDRIVEKIMAIIEQSNNLGDSGTVLNLILKSPSEFNNAIYTSVRDIAEVVVMPIAYSLLALIFLLKFATIIKRIDSGGTMNGIGVPVKLLFTFVICKIAVDNTLTILGAIYDISDQVMIGINTHLSSESIQQVGNVEANIRRQLSTLGYTDKLMLNAEVMIMSLIYWFGQMATKVILIGRMIQIYIMMAVAPIPLALFGNEHTSNISKNFLKKFAAISFHGVLMFIVLKIFGSLVNAIGLQTGSNIEEMLRHNIFLMVVLVVAIFSCGKIANSMFNAH